MSGRWIASAALAMALLGAQASAQRIKMLDGRSLTAHDIRIRVRQLMSAGHVEGLAVALIRNGRVVYRRAFGIRDKAGDPLTPQTVMYGASLTKATFAWTVMQLVDEGRVDLDRPIAAYLPRPLPDYTAYQTLSGDDRWRRLTLRILLDHTTGFANYRGLEPDHKLRFHWDPGTRYGYSGEGLNLAQFVLEQGLGLDMRTEMQRRVFDRFGMARTSLVWRDNLGANVADHFLADGSTAPHEHIATFRAASSMDTTLDDWSAFLAAVVRGDGLSSDTKADMIRRQVEIDTSPQFPTLTAQETDENRPIQLGYGLGWGVFNTPFGSAFFKEGHDDGTANYALCIQDKQACILLLSNSDRAESIFKPVVETLMGDVRLPWRWEGYRPYDLRPSH